MPAFKDFLFQKISKRKAEDSLRSLVVKDGLIDFSSNDYLGLARSEELFNSIKKRIESLPDKLNGSTGSRLLSGNAAYTEAIEAKLKNIFQAEAALLLNSGYTANLAVLSSLPGKDDTILYDELVHASIKDGARLGLAARHSFKHNNCDDLESKIKRASGRVFIVIESIYSMDGDEAPLNDIVKLSEKYDCILILDEAHSTGVSGDSGSGMACSLRLQNKVHVRIHTFGKAMGVHGACVVGSSELVQYLINFARPFIYTTALSPHSVASIECAFEFLKENVSLQQRLQENIELFLKHASHNSKSISAIQTAIFPGNSIVKKVANDLQQKGFDVRPILSPTVPLNTERLRICLHTYNTKEQIRGLTQHLNAHADKLGVMLR
jgi:8-amino-7-oxononanoate synthase